MWSRSLPQATDEPGLAFFLNTHAAGDVNGEGEVRCATKQRQHPSLDTAVSGKRHSRG